MTKNIHKKGCYNANLTKAGANPGAAIENGLTLFHAAAPRPADIRMSIA